MLTGIILLMIGMLMLVLAVNTFRHYKKLSRTGVSTDAIVKDFEFANRRRYKYPVISFTTAGGEVITKIYKVGAPRNTYQQGDKISIVYNANNPSDLFIKAAYSTNGPIALAVFGIILSIIGILLFLAVPFTFLTRP